MDIKLTPKESEEFFHTALCCITLSGYGLSLDYSMDAYKAAKESLKAKGNTNLCREDVWMEILRIGKKLTVVDEEGDGEYTRSIELKDVHEKVQNTPSSHLIDIKEDRDDAVTADCIIQTVFFDEIIFG